MNDIAENINHLILTLFSCVTFANALPTQSSVVQGQAQVNSTSQNMTGNQSSDRAIIEWQTFNVGADSTVQFKHPNATSFIHNKVNGYNGLSTIAGTLSANGMVLISNPAGSAHDLYLNGLTAITDLPITAGSGATDNLNDFISSPIIMTGIDDENNLYSLTGPTATQMA